MSILVLPVQPAGTGDYMITHRRSWQASHPGSHRGHCTGTAGTADIPRLTLTADSAANGVRLRVFLELCGRTIGGGGGSPHAPHRTAALPPHGRPPQARAGAASPRS